MICRITKSMMELRHFVECVRENRPGRVPGSDGLRALQLAETVAKEMARQAFSSSEVQVDQIEDELTGGARHLWAKAGVQIESAP